VFEEVAAMRKYLIYFALLLVGCGSNGDDGFAVPGAQPVQVRHVPEIADLVLLPNTADYMAGAGNISVTVEVSFTDIGLDIQTLWVQMPDGTSNSFAETQAAESGTFTEVFVMSTEEIGAEFWLVDKAGAASVHHTAEFTVTAEVQGSDWTNRMSGLPYTLRDVVWNGDVFVVVGRGGTILTSVDGVDWITRESGTDANLYAVTADGPYVVAVGWEPEWGPGIILQSTDHGASWTIKDRPEEAVLEAVAINSTRVVVGGNRWGWGGTAITMISEDRGDTWRTVDSWPDENMPMTDLVYRDGIFVASTNSLFRAGLWVTVSSDGDVWNEIAVIDEGATLRTIIHDDSQFILSGSLGAVFTSPDGFNWTQVEIETPDRDVFYTGAAWNGSKLVLAGPWTCGYLGGSCDSPFDAPPVGLSTTDGGATWDVFNIDGDYESWGLAWGNGRFVSVGRKPPFFFSEGAIYTAE
jgi:hypothetical protein